MPQLTKGQKRMLGALAVVVLYAVYDVSSNWDTYIAYYFNKKKKQSKILPEAVNPKISQSENRSYLKDWKEDPFYIAGRKTYTQKSYSPRQAVLKLNAISFAGENSVVMINNSILKTGDIIEGYRIEQIEQNSVSLIKNGQVIKLFLQ